MNNPNSTPFALRVSSNGPALGKKFTGLMNAAVSRRENSNLPLVIAVHGGGFHSKYFDLPGYSLLDRGAALGIPVIAIDRPNYGGSDALDDDGSIFQANVDSLDHVIDELWREHGAGAAGIFLVGHSIGAALALLLAATGPAWPLLGMSLSGCLLQEPPGMAERWASNPAVWMPVDADLRIQLMFGPTGTYDSDVLATEAAFHGDTPVLVRELIEISDGWEERLRQAAPSIRVPVHLRHAMSDRLWVSTEEQVEEFAKALVNAPVVDAELWPESGHVIDYHRSGATFQVEQLTFALNAAGRLIKE